MSNVAIDMSDAEVTDSLKKLRESLWYRFKKAGLPIARKTRKEQAEGFLLQTIRNPLGCYVAHYRPDITDFAQATTTQRHLVEKMLQLYQGVLHDMDVEPVTVNGEPKLLVRLQANPLNRRAGGSGATTAVGA